MSGRKLNPPWLMWGNSQVIEFLPGAIAPEGPVEVPSPGQVTRVDYGRPETWRFLFVCQVLNVQAASETESLDVYFDLTVGVGRAQNTLPGFEHFSFPFPVENGDTIWSTSVIGPLRSSTDDPALNRIELIPAEAIQLAARAVFTNFGSNSQAQIQVSAYFTPNTHMRPEWFEGDFPGGENSTL